MESYEFDYELIRESEFFGIKKYKDAVFKGEIQDKKRNGKGVIVYNNGRLYEGDWKDDKRDGRGYERFANGHVYHGEYK